MAPQRLPNVALRIRRFNAANRSRLDPVIPLLLRGMFKAAVPADLAYGLLHALSLLASHHRARRVSEAGGIQAGYVLPVTGESVTTPKNALCTEDVNCRGPFPEGPLGAHHLRRRRAQQYIHMAAIAEGGRNRPSCPLKNNSGCNCIENSREFPSNGSFSNCSIPTTAARAAARHPVDRDLAAGAGPQRQAGGAARQRWLIETAGPSCRQVPGQLDI